MRTTLLLRGKTLEGEATYMNEAVILGIPISLLSKERVIASLGTRMRANSFFRIATVGPEFLVRARRDAAFRRNMLRADLRISDGCGITFAGRLFGKRIPRFPGADLLHEILKEAERGGFSVFLAVRKDGLSSLWAIREAMLKRYPALRVGGSEYESTTRTSCPIPSDDIVLCNFGVPDQEYFLESLRRRKESVRLAMGVGGAFDFLTKKLSRAPRALRILGLEWLWRLFLQPRRSKRIFCAVIVFPCLVLRERFFGRSYL